MTKAEIIDDYFASLGAYPHVPFEPLGETLVEEGRSAGLGLTVSCALVEQESSGINVFGCDAGSILCHRAVDAQGVADLLRFISYGGPSNGVGVTQLTHPSLIREADAMGGAHLVRYQMRRGFSLLSGYVAQGGLRLGLAAYNGGPNAPRYPYADAVLSKRDEWKGRLG